MSRILLHAAVLMGIYLLVLTSLAPGDLLLGGALGLVVAVTLRPRPRDAQPFARVVATGALLLGTAVEMVRGSWRVVRFCLGAPASPGFVEIPRGDRSRDEVAIWGVLTGEAPDEVVVDVDEAREMMIVHLLDASDPDAVRARHRHAHVRWKRRPVR